VSGKLAQLPGMNSYRGITRQTFQRKIFLKASLPIRFKLCTYRIVVRVFNNWGGVIEQIFGGMGVCVGRAEIGQFW
jgi:hypothetical protein